MLDALLDGRARTATELAVLAEVTPATASAHLQRLRDARLVAMRAQGKHRYYALSGADVARALEALSVLAGGPAQPFVPRTPHRLRTARTCYDHVAGTLGVALHDRFLKLAWLSPARGDASAYELNPAGTQALEKLGVDVQAARRLRRRFAYACLDWSERRPHLGGALAAAVFALAMKRKWVTRDLDSRALEITSAGRRELRAKFGVEI